MLVHFTKAEVRLCQGASLRAHCAGTEGGDGVQGSLDFLQRSLAKQAKDLRHPRKLLEQKVTGLDLPELLASFLLLLVSEASNVKIL